EAVERLDRLQAIPGRMERFSVAERPQVVVDYAHTPAALAMALRSLRMHCRGELWLVFGCGGERDRGKRPQMGQIAERGADRVIVTDDNPRGEDGDAIIREITAGMQRPPVVIRDRAAAIAAALRSATDRDIVLVAGKGHETWQEIEGQRLPFSDRAVVVNLLEGTPCV
ncbi:MAG TPA: UDP-N-acetylmuramoyl-L-alanyl-D-glutamate--2,6-diaminopimelate ligase, partial [Methylothermaceae bacterium]|nr:UDP-N-acetylmuramoyl-L-alanyl-D-glutamate--2,6-diaminopimelate ligase [Methylothermaceae bacterium]